jgi:multiple sugar transport system substrate-binding protein
VSRRPRVLRRGRRASLAAVVALSMLVLTACAAGGWGVGGSGSAGKVNISYALWDPYEQIGYQKSINEFEKLHPNIHVTIQQIPYGSYQQKITAQYISGNAPDVFWVNTPWLGDWVKGGVLTNITRQVQAAHIDLAQYYPELVKLHQRNGQLYGLPKDWDTICFFYNKDYFKKIGAKPDTNLTWQPDGSGTFLPYLRRLTTDKAGHNAASPHFNPRQVTTSATAEPNDYQSGFGNYVAMNGGSVLPKQYATTSTLDSAQNQATFRWLTRTLPGRHVVVPSSLTGPNGNNDNTLTLFSEGRIAMLQTGDWLTNAISQLSATTFKVGVMPLPTGPKGRISVFNGLTDGIASNTQHPQAAWELVQWLASARSQRILGSGGYVWPAIKRLDPLFAAYWKKKGVDVTPFLTEARGKTVTFPVATGLGEALTNVTTALGPTFLGRRSVGEGLRQADKIMTYRVAYANQ